MIAIPVLNSEWACHQGECACCVRFVYNNHRSSWKNGISVTALAKDLHILPIHFRILYKLSFTVFKCLHRNAPYYFKDLLTLDQPLGSLLAYGLPIVLIAWNVLL